MSETQAVRQFSDLMNRVYYQRATVELERGNRVIARVSPISPGSPLKVKDLNKLFHELPSLRGDTKTFAKDLAIIRTQIPR